MPRPEVTQAYEDDGKENEKDKKEREISEIWQKRRWFANKTETFVSKPVSHTHSPSLAVLGFCFSSFRPEAGCGGRIWRGKREKKKKEQDEFKTRYSPREFQKNICFCFIDFAKAFDCVDHNKLWRILKEMGIPDHLTCLLRNLYAGQEATVRTGYGTTDWLQIGKGVRQGCILSLCLFNLHAEYIMRNTGLEEAQAGIKTAWRNINNLRYADDTTLWQKVKN